MGDERISRACPDCGQEIGRSTYCGCGWGKKKPGKTAGYIEPDRVKCCHDACFLTSKLRILMPTGWANLCMEHYDHHFKIKAQETCGRIGLDTVEKKRAYVRVMLSGMQRLMRERQPGDDDEEIAA